MVRYRLLIAGLMIAGIAQSVHAAQLRVEPILIEISAPAAAGVLTLRNNDPVEVAAQTRVFRWTQVNGIERLEPTTDVVASPPTVKLAPGADYVVRVVRVSKAAIQGEESYRVVVDQLPDLNARSGKAVTLLLRQSIPVFFQASKFAASDVTWTFETDGKKLVVIATNRGDERLRLASLRLRDSQGATISFGNGLVGYVLGRGSMQFTAPNVPRGFGASGVVSIAVETNKGPVNATARLVAGR